MKKNNKKRVSQFFRKTLLCGRHLGFHITIYLKHVFLRTVTSKALKVCTYKDKKKILKTFKRAFDDIASNKTKENNNPHSEYFLKDQIRGENDTKSPKAIFISLSITHMTII